MYCGNCLRDNALVMALRRMGHDVLMLPLYLPLTLDESDQSAAHPVFFGGINVYLDHHWPAFSKTPRFIRRWLASRPLLRLAAGRAAKTQPEQVGDLTLSMLRGELGRQTRDLDELTAWLQSQPRTDVIILSNALLVGMARQLKRRLGARIICHLGGEDSFLDALPESYRHACWQTLAERARELDLLLAPTRYFANLMGGRLGIPPHQIDIVPNGINLDGYEEPATLADPPVLGFFTRMSREKGLGLLVKAFIRVRQRGKAATLTLKVGGSSGPSDEPLVSDLKAILASANLSRDVSWHPNLPRDAKISFLKSLSIFSAPAVYGEAFGLYVVEAMAAGVPVVQPDTASFPELIEATGGGLLCRPNPESLADAIERLALDSPERRRLGTSARKAAFEQFSASAMARAVMKVIQKVPVKP